MPQLIEFRVSIIHRDEWEPDAAGKLSKAETVESAVEQLRERLERLLPEGRLCSIVFAHKDHGELPPL